MLSRLASGPVSSTFVNLERPPRLFLAEVRARHAPSSLAASPERHDRPFSEGEERDESGRGQARGTAGKEDARWLRRKQASLSLTRRSSLCHFKKYTDDVGPCGDADEALFRFYYLSEASAC